MELPAAQKLSHLSVRYEHPSQHPGKRCGGCEHYIPADVPRCEHVRQPIRRFDYCMKWEAK